MPEPHATSVAASLAAVAAVADAAGFPPVLVGWAMFGGLVAMANTQTGISSDPAGWRNAWRWCLKLIIAAGIGVAFAPTLVEVMVALGLKVGVILTAGVGLQKVSAVLLGFATGFIPEATALARRRLAALEGRA